MGEKLNRANGLRKILVHRYNGVDDQIILNSVSEIKKLLFQWLDIIEGVIKNKTLIEEIQNELTRLKSNYDAVLFGSQNSGDARVESDIDVAIISKSNDKELNILLQKDLMERFGTKYDIRVFELYPIHIQFSIIQNYSIIIGDNLEISEYFYQYRKKWDDCKNRIMSNQFNSYHDRLDILLQK